MPNNNCNQGTVQVHIDSPPMTLIKIKNDEKSDKDCVKIKFCRVPTSQKSDLYEFKMTLFDNGDPEELLLLIINFNMTLEASGTLVASANIQYLFMLVHG